MMELILLL
jgi:plasmid stabilization system protein ParE